MWAVALALSDQSNLQGGRLVAADLQLTHRLRCSKQATRLMNIPDVSGMSAHAHQHGMARLGNIVAAHASVGDAALTTTTLTLCNQQAKMLMNIPDV